MRNDKFIYNFAPDLKQTLSLQQRKTNYNKMDQNYSAAELRLAKNHARYALMTMFFFAGFTFATLFSRMPALKIIYDFNFTGPLSFIAGNSNMSSGNKFFIILFST